MTTFPYKTALSEANVKTNRMTSTNGPITKNGVLPLKLLSLSEKFVSVEEPHMKS